MYRYIYSYAHCCRLRTWISGLPACMTYVSPPLFLYVFVYLTHYHTHAHTNTLTHTLTHKHTHAHTHTHTHKGMSDSLMGVVCSPTDAGDLTVCNRRSLDVHWLPLCGWYVRTSRVDCRCHGYMHRLLRWHVDTPTRTSAGPPRWAPSR